MRRLRNVASLFAVTALTVLAVTLTGGGSAAAVGNTLQVPSQYATIQAAVDAANPSGGTIIVQPGTYNESVVIAKNNITIKGAPNKPNPVLLPPADDSGCEDVIGGADGICIFSFTQPRKGIEISHLTIRDFEGSGILAFNADGLNFHDNITEDNDEYGIAAFESSHIQIVNNTASGSEEAGIYIGDSPKASALVRRNTVSGNLFGIFLRDSSHGTVTENTANNNCVGILLVDTGENPDPVTDWTLVHNIADNNTNSCPESDEGPAFSGLGIVVVGASHTRLTANQAKGNVASGDSLGSGGIFVISAVCFGGADPTYVQVDHSILGGNGGFDLVYDGSGHHNTFFANGVAPTIIGSLCGGGG